MPRLGFAFEGCSCRAAFQVAAARVLVNAGVVPTAVSGASSGSMVAAAIAVGRLDELASHWGDLLGRTDVWAPRRLLRGRWPLQMSHILRPGLEAHLGSMQISDTALPLAITVTQLGRRGPREHVLGPRDAVSVVDAVMASCFIPGIYSRPVFLGGRPLLDGAWVRRTPVDPVRALGAERIVAFVSRPHGQLDGGVLRPRRWAPAADTRVLSPSEELPIRGFDFDEGRTRAAMAIGRESAHAFLETHRDWLNPGRPAM